MVVNETNRANSKAKATTTKTVSSPTAARKPLRKNAVSQVVHEIEKLRVNRENRRYQMHVDRQARQLEWRELEAAGWSSDIDFHRMIEDFRSSACSSQQPKMENKTSDDTQIRVYLRKRPIFEKELENKELDCVTSINPTCVVHECKMRVDGITKYLENNYFTFDATFDENTPTKSVYNTACKPLIDFVFTENGRATVFAYGQTGSGKTFTMVGVQHLICEDLFNFIEKMPEVERPEVSCSFFEIYGGRVLDCLNNRSPLQILEDSQNEVQITGMVCRAATNPKQLWQIMEYGNSIRTTASTSSNNDSSRSHAVCVIYLRDKEGGAVLGKMSLVDLAGSERAQEAKDSGQDRRIEGAEINKSLLALKECVRAMDTGAQHIPFRASKLTMVLRDSFVSKNSKTVMISCVSPGSASADHTVNTLRYADRLTDRRRASEKDADARDEEFVFKPATRSSVESREAGSEIRDFARSRDVIPRVSDVSDSKNQMSRRSPQRAKPQPPVSIPGPRRSVGTKAAVPVKTPTAASVAIQNAIKKMGGNESDENRRKSGQVPVRRSLTSEVKSPKAVAQPPVRKTNGKPPPQCQTPVKNGTRNSVTPTKKGVAPSPSPPASLSKPKPKDNSWAPSQQKLIDRHVEAMQQEAKLLVAEGEDLSIISNTDDPDAFNDYVFKAASVFKKKISMYQDLLKLCAETS